MNLRIGSLLVCALGLVWQSDATNGATVSVSERATDLARVSTNMGDFYIELYGNPGDSPAHVINFLQYIRDGAYENNIFHRTVSSSFSVVQSGGFQVPGGDLELSADGISDVTSRGPVPNEFNGGNGLSNTRGTIGAARGTHPDSATSQWFVNTVDNLAFDSGPYTVFGAVIRGMDVVDAINQLPYDTSGAFIGTDYQNVFRELPVTNSDEFVVTYAITEIPFSVFDGDFDFDGDVDAEDYRIWTEGFGGSLGKLPENGDANFDGRVDGNDFLIWQRGFGKDLRAPSGGGSMASFVVAVPEPTGISMLVISMLAGLVMSRRLR